MASCIPLDDTAPLDARSQYLHAVRTVVPMTEAEEASLLAQVAAGSRAARDYLITQYQPFILGIAKRFQSRCELLELLDLAQEGSVGMLMALDALSKRSASMPFRAWVFCWARSTILQAIYNTERAIRLPTAMLRRLRRLATTEASLLGELGREPTVHEVATALNVSPGEVTTLLLLQSEHVINLDELATDDGEIALGEMTSMHPAAALENASTLHQWLRDVVEGLPERERMVMTLRYGFDGDEPHTVRQVSDVLGVRPSTVQEIDRRVRHRIQTMMERFGLSARPLPTVSYASTRH